VLRGRTYALVGKQLRKMHSEAEGMFDSRVFCTNVGVRPAEPCTVSVAATHQVLTLMLEYIAQTVLAAPDLRAVAGCAYSDRDLAELECCNVNNIAALSEIVGVNEKGEVPNSKPFHTADVEPRSGGFVGGRGRTDTERALRRSGEAWAQHVLEAPRAWALATAYIVVSVTLGYPIVSGIGAAAGVSAVWALRLMSFFDSIIYAFIPQVSNLYT
jgi:hypothetical protein